MLRMRFNPKSMPAWLMAGIALTNMLGCTLNEEALPDSLATATNCEDHLTEAALATIANEIDAAVKSAPELTEWEKFLDGHAVQNAALITEPASPDNRTWNGSKWISSPPVYVDNSPGSGRIQSVIDYGDEITIAVSSQSGVPDWNTLWEYRTFGLSAGQYVSRQNAFAGLTKEFGPWKYARLEDDMVHMREVSKQAPFGEAVQRDKDGRTEHVSLRLPSYQLAVTRAPSQTLSGGVDVTLWVNGKTLFNKAVTAVSRCTYRQVDALFPNTGERLRGPFGDACPGAACPNTLDEWGQ